MAETFAKRFTLEQPDYTAMLTAKPTSVEDQLASKLVILPAAPDAAAGVSGVKIAVGVGIAAALAGVVYLVMRGGSFSANEDEFGFFPNKSRRDYHRGYRAGRRFCGE